MATSNKATWTAMQDKLLAMGYVVNSAIGEPRSGIQSGLVAVIPSAGEIDETTLSAPREVHRVILRMHQAAESEPQEDIEALLDQFRANIMADVLGEFDLGGTVGYALPAEFSWEYDTVTAQDAQWRVINLTIAYRIDDRSTFAA